MQRRVNQINGVRLCIKSDRTISRAEVVNVIKIRNRVEKRRFDL